MSLKIWPGLQLAPKKRYPEPIYTNKIQTKAFYYLGKLYNITCEHPG